MQTFKCKRCEKMSAVKGIEQQNDVSYVVCEHCSAKNRLFQRPTPLGAPIELEVVGLIDAKAP